MVIVGQGRSKMATAGVSQAGMRYLSGQHMIVIGWFNHSTSQQATWLNCHWTASREVVGHVGRIVKQYWFFFNNRMIWVRGFFWWPTSFFFSSASAGYTLGIPRGKGRGRDRTGNLGQVAQAYRHGRNQAQRNRQKSCGNMSWPKAVMSRQQLWPVTLDAS